MSQLKAIISRLESLKNQTETLEKPQRFFEINGERICSVTYEAKGDLFELKVFNKGEKPKTYEFDNIDIITIEIFDLIQ